MSHETPYAGLRVVDLSQGIAGPYCAMLLAQHGADVIKVEPPEGDWARVLGPRYGSHTAFSVIGNLGKRGIVLDLKQEGDKETLRRLLRTADVFMEGFRPGVAARLGFDFETVKALAPGIVYVSVSGFGQTGPLSAKPAMDPVLQAFTGFTHENKGHDGIPHRASPIIVDMSTALYTHQAVAAAVYAQRDDRRARFIDSSLMAAAANLQAVRMCATVMEGRPMSIPTSPSGVFRTADGWLHLVVLKDGDFQALCGLIDRPDLASDPRFAGPGRTRGLCGRAQCNGRRTYRGAADRILAGLPDRSRAPERGGPGLCAVRRASADGSDRPDFLAGAARRRRALAGAQPGRGAAAGFRVAAGHRAGARPAHRRSAAGTGGNGGR